jgi:hypothetical protein
MNRRRQPVIIREAVAALNGCVADVDLDGRHVKVTWTANGRRRLLIISKTPSDSRAAANSRSALRRLLREEGPSS